MSNDGKKRDTLNEVVGGPLMLYWAGGIQAVQEYYQEHPMRSYPPFVRPVQRFTRGIQSGKMTPSTFLLYVAECYNAIGEETPQTIRDELESSLVRSK